MAEVYGLGETLLANGNPDDALARHTTALNIARKFDDKYQLARAHRGLAAAWLATGDHRQARRHQQRAIAGYTRLGAPEADQIREIPGHAHHLSGMSVKSDRYPRESR